MGATWHYTEYYAFQGDISFLFIESVGDTIIKGKECSILENNGGLMCAFHNTTDFVYYEEGVAYFYVPAIDTFQVLFDLNASPGNSWTMVFGVESGQELDTLRVTVNSAGWVNLNGVDLKKLSVSYEHPNADNEYYDYTSEIIERIGDTQYLFNLYTSHYICDGNYSGGLRCYEDPDFGFYSTGIADSCTYIYNYPYPWIGIDLHEEIPVNIIPNPTSGRIEITAESGSELFVSVFSITGNLMLNEEMNTAMKINLSEWKSGLYIFRISRDDGEYVIRRIVKY